VQQRHAMLQIFTVGILHGSMAWDMAFSFSRIQQEETRRCIIGFQYSCFMRSMCLCIHVSRRLPPRPVTQGLRRHSVHDYSMDTLFLLSTKIPSFLSLLMCHLWARCFPGSDGIGCILQVVVNTMDYACMKYPVKHTSTPTSHHRHGEFILPYQ
jgi:hypothetical protein